MSSQQQASHNLASIATYVAGALRALKREDLANQLREAVDLFDSFDDA